MLDVIDIAKGRIVREADGSPAIVSPRIRVQTIVVWHDRMGMGVDEIATEYNLRLTDIYAALAYYHEHPDEINRAIQADETFVATFRQLYPSKIIVDVLQPADMVNWIEFL